MSLLYNFVRPADTRVLAKFLPSGLEDVVGIYMNTPSDVLIFTLNAIHWMRDDRLRTFPHEEIEKLEELYEDSDEETRELKLYLFSGEIVLLPVIGLTEEFPDIFTVYEFIVSALPSKTSFAPNWKPSDIAAINNRQDLSQFLHKHYDGWDDVLGGLIDSLNAGYPKPKQLRDYGIDERVLENPDTWRLLALFLVEHDDTEFDALDIELERRSPRDSFFLVAKPPKLELDGSELSNEILEAFNSEVQAILEFAGAEALAAGRSAVSPEFVLLALVASDSDQACKILQRSTLTVSGVRKEIRAKVKRQQATDEIKSLQLTPLSIELLIQAAKEKEKSESDEIAPVHLLEAIQNLNDKEMDALLNKFEEPKS